MAPPPDVVCAAPLSSDPEAVESDGEDNDVAAEDADDAAAASKHSNPTNAADASTELKDARLHASQ